MNDPRTLNYQQLASHCEKLKARIIPLEALKRDLDFYEGILANFDRIEADLSIADAPGPEGYVPDRKTKKGLTYIIISQNPSGITQEDIITESAKYGTPFKASSVSSLLSQLKKEHVIKKVGRLFMLNK